MMDKICVMYIDIKNSVEIFLNCVYYLRLKKEIKKIIIFNFILYLKFII